MLQRFFSSLLLLSCCLFAFTTCAKEDDPLLTGTPTETDDPSVVTMFPGSIDPADPLNYGSQEIPDYIDRDNTRGNPITDLGATLGRVLFYDKELSATRTISCASCHQQELAFGDGDQVSTGVAGTTGRHAMRLSNARFGEETRFFWDERANTLEAQTTQPIRDHIEMGFSGENGDPAFSDLLTRLNGIGYYQELSAAAYGSQQVTEDRMQLALAQFIRSMQSFDSRYDEGRARVNNNNTPFPNFTEEENRGKQLFMGRAQFNNAGSRIGGGLGCNNCHQAPEFSIDPRSSNNGVTGTLMGGGEDFTVTRSPTLRDVFRPDGRDNGPFMHTGEFISIDEVLDHYNLIPGNNPQLDAQLRPGGNPQRLNLTAAERAAVIAFMRTLTGSELYTDERWRDPFLD